VLAGKDEIKCNCTVCGSRFRIKLDRQGNVNHEATYCVYCRAMLEDIESSVVDTIKN
jgi:hypothetical protein